MRLIIQKISLFFIIGYGSVQVCRAQAATTFPVINNYKTYRQLLKETPGKEMTALKSHIPGIVYDLKYATNKNFMHRLMYPKSTRTTFLRKPAMEALLKVQQELNRSGSGIKVFDAYRPYSVSKKFWQLVHDERYVANPAKGSNHNRGTAIDLTIINLQTGRELDMGTGFDNFTDSAHHSFKNLPDEVLNNRILLKSVMQRYGFEPLDTEWWHYTYKSAIQFEVMDIPFKKL
ncbi:MAG: M15 family metallopeptidase [Niabella sp.]